MSVPRAVGAVVQALLLGLLLAFAVGRLLAVSTDARVFKYEAY